jgi:hypothetical protein
MKRKLLFIVGNFETVKAILNFEKAKKAFLEKNPQGCDVINPLESESLILNNKTYLSIIAGCDGVVLMSDYKYNSFAKFLERYCDEFDKKIFEAKSD